MGKIKCPYCFEEFESDKVLFRANTGFTQEELDREEFTSGDVDEHKRLFVKFSQRNPDEKLDRYWTSRGGTAGYSSADPRWNMPHIDPNDADRFWEMLDPDANGVGADGLVRDQDGFAIRVYDRYSDRATPVTRLCPHCHNPLPLPNYGKYPTIFISVVGITTCGKTVYLNQLLTRLAMAMQNTGYYITENNLPDFKENVEANMPLPGSTDDSVMRRPLAVNLVDQNDRSKAFTIVFYDIAGENCVKWNDDYAKLGDQDSRNSRAKEGIASFIARADGLMFLVDPNQVPGFSAYPDVSGVNKVVGVVNQIRVALNMSQNTWADVPVAVVLTKTDEIRNQYPKGNQSPMFRPTAAVSGGLNREEYFAISHELEDYLSNNAAMILAQLGQFVRKTFCGVSAITCGVERRFVKYKNWYILDDICGREYDELRAWIKGWNERSPEERNFYYACPVQRITSLDPKTRMPAVDPVTLEPELGYSNFCVGWAEKIRELRAKSFRVGTAQKSCAEFLFSCATNLRPPVIEFSVTGGDFYEQKRPVFFLQRQGQRRVQTSVWDGVHAASGENPVRRIALGGHPPQRTEPAEAEGKIPRRYGGLRDSDPALRGDAASTGCLLQSLHRRGSSGNPSEADAAGV